MSVTVTTKAKAPKKSRRKKIDTETEALAAAETMIEQAQEGQPVVETPEVDPVGPEPVDVAPEPKPEPVEKVYNLSTAKEQATRRSKRLGIRHTIKEVEGGWIVVPGPEGE